MTTTSSAVPASSRIAQRLAGQIGARRYSMWFDHTARFSYSEDDRRLQVAVPNRFVADWIGRNFEDALRRAAADEMGQQIDLLVEVKPDLFGDTQPTAALVEASPPQGLALPPARARGAEAAPASRHRLEDFIVGASNELAFAAAQRLVEDEHHPTNPLFIHGGCGLGKTHLLQGVCRRMLDRHPDARVLYATGEQFTNDFLAAMRANKLEAFRKKIRRLDLLAVDDVHFIANKAATQQEFLHSFDAIELGGARVVLASDSHPKLIRQFSEALVSRCVRGMVVEIRPPDTATRARIVRALAHRRGLCLLETVIDVIASRCNGSVREIEGTLTKLHALSTLTQQRRGVSEGASEGLSGGGGTSGAGEPIGHALVNHLFDVEVAQAPRRIVRFDSILSVVALELGVARPLILGNGRHQHAVLARSLVIHLARQMTTMSYPEIAAAMGRRNHSTIITAAQRIEKQLLENLRVTMPATMEQLPLAELAQRLRHAIART